MRCSNRTRLNRRANAVLKAARTGRRGLIVAAIAAAALTLAAGLAYATIPDNNKVFTACMLNKIGTIRLIDPSLGSSSLMGHCTSVETQISWNQQGQPGPQGPQGAGGAQGPAGKDGTNGTNGTNGKDGVSVTSATEPAGANCQYGGARFSSASPDTFACNGAPGPQGTAGAQGAKGDTGATGPAGAQGPAGKDGTSCVNPDGSLASPACQGPKGDTGATGPQGPKGDPGPQGAAGPAGPSGPVNAWATSGPGPGIQINVPAGSYLVHADADVFNPGSSQAEKSCILRADGFPLDQKQASVPAGVDEVIHNEGFVTVSSTSTLTESCDAGSFNLTLQAVAVNLH